jgi:hypothetical protein
MEEFKNESDITRTGSAPAEIDVTTSVSDAPVPGGDAEKFSSVKKMVSALDKFLEKRIAVIGGIFFLIAAICASGIISNDFVLHAATTGAERSEDLNHANAFLVSIIISLVFIFALIVARVVSVRLARKEK